MWENTLRKYTGLRPAQWVLLFCDGIVMQCVFAFFFLLRSFWGEIALFSYIWIGFSLCLGPFIMLIWGSYESPAPPAHKALKKAFLGVSLTYLFVLIVLFLGKDSAEYSRSIVTASWFVTLFAVPIMRGYVQKRLCTCRWWGAPVVFLQEKEKIQELWQELVDNPERGLRPVENRDISQNTAHAAAHREKVLLEMQQKYINPVFIWLVNGGNQEEATKQFEEIARLCRRLLLVPPQKKGVKKYWLAPRLLGETEAFLVRQNLLDSRRNHIKRCIDILLTSIALVVFCPLLLILTLWIRLSSTGPAIYKQRRIGQGGKPICIYKFRTMVQDADTVLAVHLRDNTTLREEWEKDRKLRKDPRITSVGHFLRKTSLDELPQLFNVLCGTMSLVGPRPIVDEEIPRYGDVYFDYTDVKPGITGLWQISGRNNTTYEQRISYDHYYVTHWSVWMDLWILIRTVPVALRGEGAY